MTRLETTRQLRRSGPHLTAGVASADMMDLGAAVKSVQDAGVRLLHFDVMDGQFCPALTFGPAMVKAVRTPLLKDVHLMIADPEETVGDYVRAGADIVVVNVEATAHIHRALQVLGGMENVNDPARGIVRGVALNPGTPLAAVEPLLEDVEMVCLLAVNPGWGGQGFIPAVAGKLARLVERVRREGRDILVAIDGGITRENIGEVSALGPDVIVAGSAVFKGEDPGASATALMEAARRAAGAKR